MTSKKALRQRNILEELTDNPAMRVSKLSALLGVTTETIRRDLEDMAEQGLISRTYGGAVLRQPSEPVLSERFNDFVDERAAIGKAAAPLLSGARVIMIGSGATTVQFAKRIAFEMNNIIAIVHSFGVATALSFNPTIQVVMAPGIYHSGEGAMHGTQTLRFLSDYTADWAVLGASGMSSFGPSDALMEASDVYSTMLRQSTRHMIVADHSKFDRMATARYAAWSEIDILVTDRRPEGPLARALADGRVTVHRVGD